MALKNPASGGVWNAISLSSPFVSPGSPYLSAAYRKDSLGIVYLRGKVIQVSGFASTIFSLPTGFRPVGNCRFLVASINSAGNVSNIWLEMKSSGAMDYVDGDVTAFFLDQISFATY